MDGEPQIHPLEFPEGRKAVKLILFNHCNWQRACRSLIEESKKAAGGFHWTPAAVSLRTWFKNPALRGGLRLSGKDGPVTWNLMPRMITEGEWDSARCMLRLISHGLPGPSRVPPTFSGLLHCSCGRRMGFMGAQQVYYCDRHPVKPNQLRPRVGGDRVRRAVAEALASRGPELAAFLQSQEYEPSPEVYWVEQQLRNAEEAESNRLIGMGRVRAQLETRLNNLLEPRGLARKEAYDPTLDLAFSDPLTWQLATAEELRKVCSAAVQKITYMGEEGGIRVQLWHRGSLADKPFLVQ